MMRRMNPKAHKKQNGHSHALQGHKHFKGDCNAAPRLSAKRDIRQEMARFEQDGDGSPSPH